MGLLIFYISIALGFSFLCSIVEAVLLSVSTAYIELLQKEGKPAGEQLLKLKQDIDKPLAAILTLNTAAHTIGAAGAGAQAAVVFGSAYLGIASGVLTLMILVFSEIIPKTLGAQYWRALAPLTAYLVAWLVRILYPFVLMARVITRMISPEKPVLGFNRHEFRAMAELGAREGQLEQHESKILQNLFRLSETRVEDVMTPRAVVFTVSESMTVGDYFSTYEGERFSRIPVYSSDKDHMTGFVLRSDLLLAQARGHSDNKLTTYLRSLETMPEFTPVADAFERFLARRAHIMVTVDAYGSMTGIITLEDILETLLGLEIVDEGDKIPDMRELAHRLWRKRARSMGLKIEELR